MRRLTILRHAQAAEMQPGGSDFERHLTPRGQRQAEESATRLVAANLIPDLIVASTAQRTRETADLLVTHGVSVRALRHDARAYLASCGTLLGIVRETAATVSHLLLVGHNPGASDLCRVLGCEPRLCELATAAWWSVELHIDNWADAGVNRTGHERVP